MTMKLVVFLVLILEPVRAKHITLSSAGNKVKDIAEKHSFGYKMAVAYKQCYEEFLDYSVDTNFQDMCRTWDKLTICKQRVKAQFPKVEDFITMGREGSAEFTAKFWCTHKPDPYIPIYDLWYKYNHCPNVHWWFLVLPRDYAVRISLTYRRTRFAYTAMKVINIPRLRQWQPKNNYSDPADPVYQALSSYYCMRHYSIQYRFNLVEKYCFIGDVGNDLEEQLLHYERIHEDGLYNWQPRQCPSVPEDPVKRILNLCDLETWLKLQVNSSLDQCHAKNVAALGGSCIIMFYARTRPFTDVNLFMQDFCSQRIELNRCWDDIVRVCPKQSVNSDMDVLIKLHQLACDLSLENSSQVWEIIYRWSDTVRKVHAYQSRMQMMTSLMHVINDKQLSSSTFYSLPFASTLNTTLTTQPQTSSHVWRLFQQMVVYLDRVSLYTTYHFQGLNVLHQLHKLDNGVAVTISQAMFGPIELFLMVAGFIDYDPTSYTQWPWISR